MRENPTNCRMLLKRLVLMTLSFLMCVSLLSVQSFAAENNFISLQNAIANAEDNVETVISIGADIEFTDSLIVPENKKIVLKVGNDASATLYPNAEMTHKPLLQVEEGGELTIDGNIVFDCKSAISPALVYGKLVMNNGIIENGTAKQSNENCGITVSGENALFILNDGIIRYLKSSYSNNAAIYIKKNAKVIMNGGTITGNTFDNQFCAAVVIDDSSFEMNGGEISNNTCLEQIQSSGGVLVFAVQSYANADNAKDSSFVMNGGKISNNKGFRGAGVYVYGGGVVYTDFYSKASFVMNGGEISENDASNFSDLTAAGGGVYVEWNSSFVMNDGIISNNSTTGMGGGVATNDGFTNYFGKVPYSAAGNRNYNGFYYRNWPNMFPASFTLNGGSIVDNKAASTSIVGDEGCGGGVYIASNKVVLNAGDISNNISGKQGGGVYVGSVPYVLRMYDVVITENNASVIGGGAWFCPTSDIDLFVNDGGALFGNIAEGAGDDLVAVHNTAKYHATIADRMLGGGAHNWYQDGAIDATGILGYADTSVPRYDENGDNASYSNIYYSTAPYSLKAVPTEEAQQLAKSLAKLTITGNSSKRGGGIGSNGGVVIGKSYEGTRDITINKEWIGGTDIPDEVTLWLVINGYRTEKIVVTKANNWTATVTGLPSGRDIVITIEEDPVNNWKPSYKYAIAPSGDTTVTVTNTRDIGNLIVSKTVSGTGADREQLFDFIVTLDDNTIAGTFGEMTFTGGVAEFKLKDGKSKTAEGLPAGISFTVNENSEDYEVTKSGETGTIVADETLTAAFNNHKDGKVTVTVRKNWEDSNNKNRPESIKVQLYKDGVAYGDIVELNERNSWKAEWNDLIDTSVWTVEEVDVPEGYTSSITHNENDWVITNTLKNVPPTGDRFDNGIMMMVAISSLALIVTMLMAKRKVTKIN